MHVLYTPAPIGVICECSYACFHAFLILMLIYGVSSMSRTLDALVMWALAFFLTEVLLAVHMFLDFTFYQGPFTVYDGLWLHFESSLYKG